MTSIANFHDALAEAEVRAFALRYATGRKVSTAEVMSVAAPFLALDGYCRLLGDRHLWQRPTFPMPNQYMERLIHLIAYMKEGTKSGVLSARLDRIVAELEL